MLKKYLIILFSNSNYYFAECEKNLNIIKILKEKSQIKKLIKKNKIIVYLKQNIPENKFIEKYFKKHLGKKIIIDFSDLISYSNSNKIDKIKNPKTEPNKKIKYIFKILKNLNKTKKINKYLFTIENCKLQTPKGLYYFPKFISKIEHNLLLSELNKSEEWKGISLKTSSGNTDTRKVIHYGYEYSYNRSGLNPADPIPPKYLKLLRRAKKYLRLEKYPDQLILNNYKPGQGISPHTDHTKQFKDFILCLSLGSDTSIRFTHESKDPKNINIQNRSLYIMSDESRWSWKHGFTLDKKLSVPRISLTFRYVNLENNINKNKNK